MPDQPEQTAEPAASAGDTPFTPQQMRDLAAALLLAAGLVTLTVLAFLVHVRLGVASLAVEAVGGGLFLGRHDDPPAETARLAEPTPQRRRLSTPAETMTAQELSVSRVTARAAVAPSSSRQ